MTRPLQTSPHRHTLWHATTLAAASLLLLAGCAHNGITRAPRTQPLDATDVATTDTVDSTTTTAPAKEVIFATNAGTHEFDATFTNVANTRDFDSDAGSALSPHSRNISVFGDVTPAMSPTPSTFDRTIDGDDNLTRITYSPVGGDYDPDISPDGQLMVFSSTQHHPTADIYLKGVDGRSVTQLTTDPAHDVMPVFSPDGRRVAFASDRAGNWDIYVMSVNGGQPMQVTNDPSQELHASWSPDGSQLVFSRLSTQSGRWELWVADLEDTGTHQFLCYGLFPEWSPNPSQPQIAFQRARQRDSRLFGVWTIDYVNGEAINPTEIVASTNAALINPTWSPDGDRLVFAAVLEPFADSPSAANVADLWMVDATGLHRVNLTSGRFTCLMPEWSSNGQIFFVSNREGVENIWSIGPERGLLASAPDQFSTNRRTARNNDATTASPNNTTTRTNSTPSTASTPDADTATATAPTELLGEVDGQ